MAFELFVNNDNLVSLLGLTDVQTGMVVNTATVQVTLRDTLNRVITGPITMPHVPTSSGNYQAVIPATTGIVAGQSYRATITATGTGTAEWDIPVTAQWRDAVSP